MVSSSSLSSGSPSNNGFPTTVNLGGSGHLSRNAFGGSQGSLYQLGGGAAASEQRRFSMNAGAVSAAAAASLPISGSPSLSARTSSVSRLSHYRPSSTTPPLTGPVLSIMDGGSAAGFNRPSSPLAGAMATANLVSSSSPELMSTTAGTHHRRGHLRTNSNGSSFGSIPEIDASTSSYGGNGYDDIKTQKKDLPRRSSLFAGIGGTGGKASFLAQIITPSNALIILLLIAICFLSYGNPFWRRSDDHIYKAKYTGRVRLFVLVSHIFNPSQQPPTLFYF